jgi:FkbM family methyltransferase
MNPHLIYDVGAHKGEDTEFYLKKGFSVIAIEADPNLAGSIRARFHSEINSGQLTVIGAAIARTAGWVEFFANRHRSVWGTIERKWADRNKSLGAPSEILQVPAVTFDSVLSDHGIPYYLKIDIEGADLLCLKALKNFSGSPKYISIESEKTRWSDLLYEFELFQSLGYDRFKIIDQGTVCCQSPPESPLEGRYVVHDFVGGSSGLFGDELPGEWLTASGAINAYRRIFVGYLLFGDNTIGRRVLKKTPLLGRFSRLLLPSWHDTHARHRATSNSAVAPFAPGRGGG